MQSHPCVVFLTGKDLFSSPANPVLKTGFSLCGNTTYGKPCSGPVLALYGIAVYQNVLQKPFNHGLRTPNESFY